MNLLLNVHHVRFAVKDINKFVQLLKSQLQFWPYAVRSNCSPLESENTVVFRHQDVIFVIDQRNESNKTIKNQDNILCWGNNFYPVDTACDLCLECSNIEDTIEKAMVYDKNCMITGLKYVEDEHGTVKYAVLKPPIGNIQHTLVDLSDYQGLFLPGFKLTSNSQQVIDIPKSLPDLVQTIDHVAFALKMGQTDSVVDWYNHCMMFSRLIINEGEDEKEGFVVKQGGKGLRLKALFGPLKSSLCNEPPSNYQNKVPKLVFGEGLHDDIKTDHISFFLHMHHGPGLQHIAFATKDIVKTVSRFKESGLNCVSAPDAYYNEISKGEEIKRLEYEVDTLKTNDILLESHLGLSKDINPSSVAPFSVNTDVKDQMQQVSNTQWFIMQVFTKPVFPEKTVFFEIIQRFQTLSGFGAGNISALWKAAQNEFEKK